MLALKMGPRSRGPGEFRVLVMHFCVLFWRLVCLVSMRLGRPDAFQIKS